MTNPATATKPIDTMADTDDQRESLHGIVEILPREELLVLRYIADGLVTGLTIYGPLDLRRDPRDFRREAAAEYRDAAVYHACDAVRGMLCGPERGDRLDTIPAGAEDLDPDWERER